MKNKKTLVSVLTISLFMSGCSFEGIFESNSKNGEQESAQSNETQENAEYLNWKQSDPRWKSIPLGDSDTNIGKSGCLATAIAIHVARSGADTGSITEFNPGTLVQALNSKGGFTSSGAYYWYSISKVIPSFKYVANKSNSFSENASKEEKFDIIKGIIDEGYYVVVQVKGKYNNDNGQHWVAIVDYDESTKNLKMIDPSSRTPTGIHDLWKSDENINNYYFQNTSRYNSFKYTK